MAYQLIKPVGFYPPLVWKAETDGKSIGYSFWVTLANWLIRFLCYPFNFIFSMLVTLVFVITATFFNGGWLLGGGFSNFWSAKTKQLNQIAITRCLWLIFDSLGFLWNQVKLMIGLFIPQYAISTIQKLKNFTEPLTKSNIFHFDWQQVHQSKMIFLFNFLKHYNYTLSLILVTLCAEPVDAILFGFRFPRGWGNNFHPYGLNPHQLTDEQKKHPALLLLHGNYHNQSAWLPLAEYLHTAKYPGAIFTVNLPAGEVTKVDIKHTQEKISAIKDIYTNAGVDVNHIKINLIGHSRGTTVAYNAGLSKKADNSWIENSLIGKTILIGSGDTLKQIHPCRKTGSLIPIFGRYDALSPYTDVYFQSTHKLVDAGHLGLLSHPDTLKHCEKLIKEDSSFHNSR